MGATLTGSSYTDEACVCLCQRSVWSMELSVAAGRKAVLDLLPRFKANLEKKGALAEARFDGCRLSQHPGLDR